MFHLISKKLVWLLFKQVGQEFDDESDESHSNDAALKNEKQKDKNDVLPQQTRENDAGGVKNEKDDVLPQQTRENEFKFNDCLTLTEYDKGNEPLGSQASTMLFSNNNSRSESNNDNSSNKDLSRSKDGRLLINSSSNNDNSSIKSNKDLSRSKDGRLLINSSSNSSESNHSNNKPSSRSKSGHLLRFDPISSGDVRVVDGGGNGENSISYGPMRGLGRGNVQCCHCKEIKSFDEYDRHVALCWSCVIRLAQ